MLILRAIKALGSLSVKVSKHSPKILTALGILGYGYSVYEATKIPEKTKAVHEEYKRTGDKKKFIRGYVKATAKTAGSFAFATICTLRGQVVIHGRYTGVVAALAAKEKIFSKYRGRVIEKEGVEADQEYMLGVVDKVSIEDADKEVNEDGEYKVVHRKELRNDPKSLYTMIFDERNPQYETIPELRGHNLTFLMDRYNALKDRLIARRSDFVKGHLTANEVWTDLGFDRLLDKEQSNAAMVVGWTDEDTMSFGSMFDEIVRDPRAYLRGDIPYIVIELNPVGVILDQI